MRQTISGLVAAFAVMAAGAAPAMACGDGGCGLGYLPAPVYSGCNAGCGGWAFERLSDPELQYHPVQQYYYVNQGPTYTGPGDFAPYPTYQESAVSGWNAYRRPYYYGYDGGRYADAVNHRFDGAPYGDGPAIYRYRFHRHFQGWHGRHAFRGYRHHSIRYGYSPYRGLRHGGMAGMSHHPYGPRRHY